MKKNKRGLGTIIFFFLILMLILILGVVGALGLAIFKYSSNTVTPLMEGLGMVGNSNLSQAAELSFGTLDSMFNIAPWLIGFLYVVALIGSIGFAVGYRISPNPIFVGLYLAFIILLLLFSIIISNAYQDLYTGTGVIATELQGMTLMSYMILYSPVVMIIIAFITGIFFFALKDDSAAGSYA